MLPRTLALAGYAHRQRTPALVCHTRGTHVEDLEACDVKDSNEVLSLLLRVQRLVTLLDQELEAAVKHGLGQGTHGVETLILGSSLRHELVADFDTRFAQVLVQISR